MTDKKIIDIFILDVEDEHINYAVEYVDGTTKTFRRKTALFKIEKTKYVIERAVDDYEI